MALPDDLKAKLFAVIADQLEVPVDSIEPDKALRTDLGADSLDQVKLVMGIEEEFEIEVADEEAEKCITVQNIMDLIEPKLSQKSAS